MDRPPSFLTKPDGARIAYHMTLGKAPGIVFLGGFASDMTGTKAMGLEAYAKQRGQAFLRFDYQGHGQSSGAFAEGTIGVWHSDALAAIDTLTEGPQILVGSSMGGWMMLLTAAKRPDLIAGLVGIASAPDFTEDLMWPNFNEEIRETLLSDGLYQRPSEYSGEPYTITMKLIKDGRDHLLLRDPLSIDAPVRLLHGMADNDVPYQVSLKIAEHVTCPDLQVRLIKDGDHRLSTERDLAILTGTIDAMLERA
jgi:pimeloyl-ACP methyl ester carboxylesterase